MPTLQRPDGTRIAWREAGSGPPVTIANIGYAHAGVLQGLIDELASDHRVLAYDPRGTGDSSRHGPYEIGLDADDLIAVLVDAGVREAVAVGNGDGADRSILAAGRRAIGRTHHRHVADGPMSRLDLTAEAVRALTRTAAR